MPEIYNLSTLCRCCHADGTFKSLNASYRVEKNVEIYETMLADTLGITIQAPPLDASYTICDKCIIKLRQASNFKKQVLQCEQKFIEYCRNEQFLNTAPVLKEEIKTEIGNQEQEVIDNDTTKLTEAENNHNDLTDCKQEIKEDEEDVDVDIEQLDDISCTEDNITSGLKEGDFCCTEDNITSDFKEEEDPHTKENQENVTNEDQANIKLTKNEESENESEEPDLEIDTSCIIEKETINGLKYSCKDCGGHYSKKNLIYRHLYTNHDSLKCKYCNKILKSLASYRIHTKNHIDKKYQCEVCYKKFNIKLALKKHMEIHLNAKNFVCDFCNKSFKLKSVLKIHILMHLGLNKNKLCELCGLSFNDNSNLRIHVRSVHEKLRPFACNLCSKTYTAKKHLKAHQIKHSNLGIPKNDESENEEDPHIEENQENVTNEDQANIKLTENDEFENEEDPHIKENQENVPNEDQANIKLTKNEESENESEEPDLEIDKSCIIQKETINGLKYSCKDCGGHYSKKNLIYRHLYTNHDSLKCKYCKKILKSLASYRIHTTNHIDKKYQCEVCYKKFNIKLALKKHMEIHFNAKNFVCDYCKKSFKLKSVLRKHILIHLGLSKNKLCDLCGLSCNDISNLRSHIRSVHEKLRPFACNLCSKTYTAKKHLKAHQIKHSNPGIPKKKHPCEICDRKYSSLETYKIHRLSHDSIFKCRHCSKKFKGRDTLNDHIKEKHDAVFSCTECGKILSSRNTLSRHLNEHFGIKYTCDVCNKSFSQKAIMVRHKNGVHNPEKNEKVKCSKCNKNVSNIVKHMKSHDDRKFTCDMCPKSYAVNNTLTRHKLQAHLGRTFDCEVCGKKYMQKSKLNTHRFKVHNIKSEVKKDNVEGAG